MALGAGGGHHRLDVGKIEPEAADEGRDLGVVGLEAGPRQGVHGLARREGPARVVQVAQLGLGEQPVRAPEGRNDPVAVIDGPQHLARHERPGAFLQRPVVHGP
jgi:hypothetical protein